MSENAQSKARAAADKAADQTDEHAGEAQTRASFDALRDDLRSLRDDVTNLFQDLVDTGKREARSRAKHVHEAGEAAYERTRDEATAAHEKVADYIAERPLTSLALAVGVGAVLSRLLK